MGKKKRRKERERATLIEKDEEEDGMCFKLGWFLGWLVFVGYTQRSDLSFSMFCLKMVSSSFV